MRRSALFLVVLGLAAVPGICAEEAKEEKQEGFAERHEMALKWANFVVLAGALGYMIGKNAGPFFDARSRKIRREMIEAGDARKEADARAAAVEHRLANLEAEIAAMKEESQREAQAEGERVARQTAAEIAKIQEHAEQEIASAGKAARMDLKRYSAELAVGLAEQKIRGRMTPVAEDRLVERFVRNLDRSRTPAT